MESNGRLTTEKLCEKFGNRFDLVSYAIKVAENMIITGRDPRVRIDSQNRALQVLEEISQGKDFLQEIVEEEPEEVPFKAAVRKVEAEDKEEEDETEEETVLSE